MIFKSKQKSKMGKDYKLHTHNHQYVGATTYNFPPIIANDFTSLHPSHVIGNFPSNAHLEKLK